MQCAFPGFWSLWPAPDTWGVPCPVTDGTERLQRRVRSQSLSVLIGFSYSSWLPKWKVIFLFPLIWIFWVSHARYSSFVLFLMAVRGPSAVILVIWLCCASPQPLKRAKGTTWHPTRYFFFAEILVFHTTRTVPPLARSTFEKSVGLVAS